MARNWPGIPPASGDRWLGGVFLELLSFNLTLLLLILSGGRVYPPPFPPPMGPTWAIMGISTPTRPSVLIVSGYSSKAANIELTKHRILGDLEAVLAPI